ncbi:MAG: acyloxyacyl hydrolase [Desulfobacterales bacterium]|jgi:hypothetical protein|nr:acyloxyacyl hydrolase [Desulfobacteraceae bacterium]MBT4364127.1 acyloxyacyl hydrolase [Desulfobacteraceae bacterium]MBT7086704.1 acyloxyacyl hydrolase [Desulfobacterales bacterium]MBT7698497.1 acyloxyacyl hydrolase [Desulfobacterales bacterium]
MGIRQLLIVLIILLFLVVPQFVIAEDSDWLSVGVRGGPSAIDKDENFNMLDVFLVYGLPWSLNLTSNIALNTRVNASLGVMEGGGDTGVIATAGPGFVIERAGGRFQLDIGGGFVLMSEDVYGNQDFDEKTQLYCHIGFNYLIDRNWITGYKFYHLSNAGFHDKNPGLDYHLFEISYRY